MLSASLSVLDHVRPASCGLCHDHQEAAVGRCQTGEARQPRPVPSRAFVQLCDSRYVLCAVRQMGLPECTWEERWLTLAPTERSCYNRILQDALQANQLMQADSWLSYYRLPARWRHRYYGDDSVARLLLAMLNELRQVCALPPSTPRPVPLQNLQALSLDIWKASTAALRAFRPMHAEIGTCHSWLTQRLLRGAGREDGRYG